MRVKNEDGGEKRMKREVRGESEERGGRSAVEENRRERVRRSEVRGTQREKLGKRGERVKGQRKGVVKGIKE